MRNELSTMQTLKPVYVHSFDLCRDHGTAHKLMKYEVAEVLWAQLLGLVYPYAEEWRAFLKENEKPKKAITQDVWAMFYQFMQVTAENKAAVNTVIEEGVWPVLIEDFAKYLKAKFKL